MIALLAAVPFETEALRKILAPCEVLNCDGYPLYRGHLHATPVELLHCGVGKANAAAAAMLLAQRQPEAMIVFGCGGALPGSGLRNGDLALASREIFADEGVITPAGFHDLRAMRLPLLNTSSGPLYNELPVDAAWLARAEARLSAWAAATGIGFASGPFLTVSTCSGSTRTGLALTQRCGGLCENMEGAAVALVCTRLRIPFCEIRGISNPVEDRNLSRWDLPAGARTAQQAVQVLLSHGTEEHSA